MRRTLSSFGRVQFDWFKQLFTSTFSSQRIFFISEYALQVTNVGTQNAAPHCVQKKRKKRG